MEDNTIGIDIFRHVLFRIAAENFNVLESNNELYSNIRDDIFSIKSLINDRNRLKVLLCDNIIYNLIKNVNSEIDRKRFINLKRDIFNERIISSAQNSFILSSNSDILIEHYEKYINLLQAILKAKEKLFLKYQLAYNEDISLIKSICNKQYFLNGLLLSSEVLLQQAIDFVEYEKNIDESTILGLWKYVTRALAKTTPFSTLTQLNIATLTSRNVPFINIKENSTKILSSIRYNNYILELIQRLVKNSPIFYNSISVSTNPTLEEKDDDYVFFTNNNNIESFQKIKKSGIIEYILNQLSGNKSIKFGELIKELLSVLDSTITEERAIKYVQELIQTGLISLNLNLSGLDSQWDHSLIEFLKKSIGNQKEGLELLELFEKFRVCRSEYSVSNSDGRKFAIKKMNFILNEICSLLFIENENNNDISSSHNFIKSEDNKQSIFLHQLPSKMNFVNFKNIIYEDTTKDIKIEISNYPLLNIVNKINLIISNFSFVCTSKNEKILNYNFYRNNFKDEPKVKLLKFYDKLYRENNKPREQNDVQTNIQSVKGNINIYERIKQFILAQKDLNNIVFQNNECEINDIFFIDFQNQFKKDITEVDKLSYSAFMQFVFSSENENLNIESAILTSILPGKGKMISRFLHLFPNNITSDLIEWNIETMGKDEIYAENSDASFFNANLHPTLMPYEIEMPGGNNREIHNLINVADLFVKPNDIDRELELFDKNGKRVIIFDLGFQSMMGRSHLYRLLMSFGNNYGFSNNIINNLFNNIFCTFIDTDEPNLKIVINPRITIEHILIIQRKSWKIPSQLILNVLKNVRKNIHAEVYLYIQNWRIQYNIPDEVFIRIYHIETATNQILNKDDYKPQYINFLSPLSIKLFIKMVSKIKNGNVIIEEMLPDSKQLLSIGSKNYVNEVLVQWQ